MTLPDATRHSLLGAQRALAAARRMVRSRIGAARLLELAMKTARDHPYSIAGADALYELALWHRKQGEFDLAMQATAAFLKVGKLHPRWAEVAVRQAAEDGSAEYRFRAGHKRIASADDRQAVLDALNEIGERAPYLASDPEILFLSAHNQRGLHRFDDCRRFYDQWAQGAPTTDWGRLAAAEAWLLAPPHDRPPAPPLPMMTASRTPEPLTVDGKLDERCYTRGGDRPLRTFENQRPPKGRRMRVWTWYDADYLYVAAELSLERAVSPDEAPTARRRDQLDPDAPTFTVLLDIDRDVTTAYHIAVDVHGNGLDALDDDASFDIADQPRFKPDDPVLKFAHAHEETTWSLEFAIPLPELTFAPPQPGEVWAVQFVYTSGSERFTFRPCGARDASQPHRFGFMAFAN